jgi:hypothetical protein
MRDVIVAAISAAFTASAIAAVTPDNDVMPDIRLLSGDEINEIYCPSGGCLNTVALYNRETQTITINETFDPADEYDLSVLLHEFIHHLQNINGDKRTGCAGDMEKQAYETQRRFLETRGTADTSKLMGIDTFTQLLITTCDDR